jgi:type IV pilus assembly protein PilW
MSLRVRGFSLLELMLSLALGTLVVIAIVQLFVTNSSGSAVLSGQARLQENARTAMELIARSVRNAGFYGCGSYGEDVVVTLRGHGPEIFEFDTSRPVRSIAGGDGYAWFTAQSARAPVPTAGEIAGDVLLVRSIGMPQLRLMQPLAPAADPRVEPFGAVPLRVDDVVMVSDCEQAAIFRVTGITEADDAVTLHRAAGDVGDPFANAGPAARLSRTGRDYGRDAIVAPLWVTAYYVAPSTTDVNNRGQAVPALWMKQGPRAPVEMVAGVEHLGVRFGVDDTPTADVSRVHRWLPYAEVPLTSRIVAVEVALTVNSVDATGRDGSLLRRSFRETILLRNGSRP